MLGKMLLDQNKDEEAIKVYKMALKVYPSNFEIKTNLALILLRLDSHQEASKYLQESS